MQRAPRALSQLYAISRRMRYGGRSAPCASSLLLPLSRAAGLSTADVAQARGFAGAAHQTPVVNTGLTFPLHSQEHGRLESENVAYFWTALGNYPAESVHFSVSRGDAFVVRRDEDETTHRALPMYQAKRRYNSGQARRLRKQRQQSKLRRGKRKAPSTAPLLTKIDLSPVNKET